MEFQMIQEDIDKGLKRQSRACPVWRCLRRAKVKCPSVQRTALYWEGADKKVHCVGLPYRVQQFIRAFDMDRPVKPIGFSLNLIDIENTNALKQACDTMGIKLLDHVIVAGDEWFAFNREGLL